MDEQVEETVSVAFKVSYQKTAIDIKLPIDSTVSDIKEHVFETLNIAQSLQKLLFRGTVLKDATTLQSAKITNGSKITLMAAQPQDILNITIAKPVQTAEAAAEETRERILDATEHQKIIKGGVPPDVERGIVGVKTAIPPGGITNLRNHLNTKTRISILPASQELQIATAERTRKIPISSIQSVVSEAIPGHEGYYAVALQLGPTIKSRYWVYWVPAQYKNALEDAVLGPFRLWI
ncbi:hypothetical protein BC829DRAFT_408680 [Chytridium lagenaria]|nr:hypothetical protein BC829DRAFT_408680 [Chytridium lagenaria]